MGRHRKGPLEVRGERNDWRRGILGDPLTPREMEVVQLIREGLLNKEIAFRLGVSERMIKQHNNRIFRKLGLDNRTKVAVSPCGLLVTG